MRWFEKAVTKTRQRPPGRRFETEELRRFWSEAAELLGAPGPDPPGQGDRSDGKRPGS
jgi:hypothetical protein